MIMSNNTSSNKAAVPEAKGALNRFKFEVANEPVSYTHLASSKASITCSSS